MSDQPPKTETAADTQTDDSQQLNPTAELTESEVAEVNADAESGLTAAEATPEPQTDTGTGTGTGTEQEEASMTADAEADAEPEVQSEAETDTESEPEAVAQAETETVSEDPVRFEELALPEPLLKAITKLGFEECTPIQGRALPFSLSDYDVTGQAQTGTGKTAAFLITLLTRFWENPPQELSLIHI